MLTADDIDGFRRGDSDAVRQVYREYGRLVFAVARNMLASKELAEEATQQTFVKAWQAATSFDTTPRARSVAHHHRPAHMHRPPPP